MNLSESAWDILIHATANGDGSRDYYSASPNDAAEMADLAALEAAGLMRRVASTPVFPDANFRATENGLRAAKTEHRRRMEARGLKAWRVWWVEHEAEGRTVYARTRGAARWDALSDVDRDDIPCALREIRVRRAV